MGNEQSRDTGICHGTVLTKGSTSLNYNILVYFIGFVDCYDCKMYC